MALLASAPSPSDSAGALVHWLMTESRREVNRLTKSSGSSNPDRCWPTADLMVTKYAAAVEPSSALGQTWPCKEGEACAVAEE
jgi:hypothetical protein